MREMLFKAKRIDNGKWLEGYYASVDGVHYIYTGALCNGGLYVVAERFEIDSSTLCQYTGLTDKNGKKIWENDIVKTSKFGRDDGNGHNFSGFDVFSVKWDSGGFALFNHWRRFNLREDKKEYKVIGNIFDNPELLKDGDRT